MVSDVFPNLNDSMTYSTFSPWIPYLLRGCSWVEGVHWGIDLWVFQSLSHTHISTVPVAAPLWVLQEHTLTKGCVKHRRPDRMGPALCESTLWCTGLPLPVCLLAVPAPCASPHWEHRQEFVLQSIAAGGTGWHRSGWGLGAMGSWMRIPIATPSHYECQDCSFNFKFISDVPRNWPLLMEM